MGTENPQAKDWIDSHYSQELAVFKIAFEASVSGNFIPRQYFAEINYDLKDVLGNSLKRIAKKIEVRAKKLKQHKGYIEDKTITHFIENGTDGYLKTVAGLFNKFDKTYRGSYRSMWLEKIRWVISRAITKLTGNVSYFQETDFIQPLNNTLQAYISKRGLGHREQSKSTIVNFLQSVLTISQNELFHYPEASYRLGFSKESLSGQLHTQDIRRFLPYVSFNNKHYLTQLGKIEPRLTHTDLSSNAVASSQIDLAAIKGILRQYLFQVLLAKKQCKTALLSYLYIIHTKVP